MAESYNALKAFAEQVDRSKKDIPLAGDTIARAFEDVRTNFPTIKAARVSEVFRPAESDLSKPGQLIVLRWGDKFVRSELDERRFRTAMANITKPDLSGNPKTPQPVSIIDADYKYITARVELGKIPSVTISGLSQIHEIDLADFFRDPNSQLSRGLYLALPDPATYSRTTIFSGSQVKAENTGFLCKPDGTLVSMGISGANFSPEWNVFNRPNFHRQTHQI